VIEVASRLARLLQMRTFVFGFHAAKVLRFLLIYNYLNVFKRATRKNTFLACKKRQKRNDLTLRFILLLF
jgi:hypothetical protein